ncbi:hypothetical protein [Fodinicola acaciae]|uniref:hypothetical protein n=1 Tax=Fodinicola acaciae TaxID=2681555 RepID=UPI0013D6E784|nr:hypothetical protein [Fodinicola acaciae]
MSASDDQTQRPQNAFLAWLRHAFLRPDYVKQPRPKRSEAANRLEHRRNKVRYQMNAGRFRTWVYAAALLLFVVVFVLLVWLAG